MSSNQTQTNGLFDLGVPVNIATLAVLSVTLFLALLSLLFLTLHEDRITIRLAQPGTSFLAFFGFILIAGGLMIGIIRPMTDTWCLSRLFLTQLGLIMTLASLMFKSFRIFLFYRSAKRNPLRLSREKFMIVIFIAVVLHTVVLFIWALIPDYSLVPSPLTDGKLDTLSELKNPQFTAAPVCQSMNGLINLPEIVALSFLGAIALVWLIFALLTANATAKLNENALLSCLVGILCGAVSCFVEHAQVVGVYIGLEYKMLADSVCLLLFCVVVAVLTLYPKIFNQPHNDEDLVNQLSSSGGGEGVHSKERKKNKNQKKRRKSSYKTTTSTLSRNPSSKQMSRYHQDDDDDPNDDDEEEEAIVVINQSNLEHPAVPPPIPFSLSSVKSSLPPPPPLPSMITQPSSNPYAVSTFQPPMMDFQYPAYNGNVSMPPPPPPGFEAQMQIPPPPGMQQHYEYQ